MAGARTAVVVVVAGTKAAADWMEMIAAASESESLRVIFFEAWMKLVSVRSGGTDVIVKVEWMQGRSSPMDGRRNAQCCRSGAVKCNGRTLSTVDSSKYIAYLFVNESAFLPSGTFADGWLDSFLPTKEALKCVVAVCRSSSRFQVEVDPKMTF